jgi:hypothetical protein
VYPAGCRVTPGASFVREVQLHLPSQPEHPAAMREQAGRDVRPRAALDIAERMLAELRSGVYA